uniref:Uncharacterized protein n=1 Tax=viral metagenome TaxID=1070528 RepID=A0A6M3LRS7_9ZZZZ
MTPAELADCEAALRDISSTDEAAEWVGTYAKPLLAEIKALQTRVATLLRALNGREDY